MYKGTYKGMHVPEGGSLSVEAQDRRNAYSNMLSPSSMYGTHLSGN